MGLMWLRGPSHGNIISHANKTSCTKNILLFRVIFHHLLKRAVEIMIRFFATWFASSSHVQNRETVKSWCTHRVVSNEMKDIGNIEGHGIISSSQCVFKQKIDVGTNHLSKNRFNSVLLRIWYMIFWYVISAKTDVSLSRASLYTFQQPYLNSSELDFVTLYFIKNAMHLFICSCRSPFFIAQILAAFLRWKIF